MNKSEEERQKYSNDLKSWVHMYKYGSFTWTNNSPSVEDAAVLHDDRRRYCAVHQRLIRRYRRRPGEQLGMYKSSSILAFDPHVFDENHK